MGIFESLAADDSQQRVAHRKSLAAARVRVNEKFGAFLDAAPSPEERSARLTLVRGDIAETIASACSEYGGDPQSIETSIISHLATTKQGYGFDSIGEGYGPEDYPENDGQEGPGGLTACARCGRDITYDQGATETHEGEVCSQCQSRLGKVAALEDTPGALSPGSRDQLGIEQPETINLEPNWDGMQAWLDNVARTDPEVAQGIADASGGKLTLPGQEADPYGGAEGWGDPNRELDSLDGGYYGSVHEARRPKMCPYHKEVTDISLAAGDPASGFNAMSQHAWGSQHCQGNEYEGRCNFKPEMTTQTYWDKKAEQAQERRERRQQEQIVQEPQVPDSPEALEGDESLSEAPEEGSLDAQLEEAPSAVGEGSEPQETSVGELEPMAAATRRAEALETIDIEKDTKPKTDKSEWGNQEFIDAEMSGSPHPTKSIDPMEPQVADNNSDFLEGTRAVTEQQDLSKDSQPNPIKDNNGWGGNNGASPVTHEVQSALTGDPQSIDWANNSLGEAAYHLKQLGHEDIATQMEQIADQYHRQSYGYGMNEIRPGATPRQQEVQSARIDPNVNPIRELLEQDFVPHNQVNAAIQEFENGR